MYVCVCVHKHTPALSKIKKQSKVYRKYSLNERPQLGQGLYWCVKYTISLVLTIITLYRC